MSPAATLLRLVGEGWVQGGREGAGEMGVRGRKVAPRHPCCAGLIVVHLYCVQELGACADDQPRGDPRRGRWHGRRRARQQPGVHVPVRLPTEQVEGRRVCAHRHCGGAAWSKCPLDQAVPRVRPLRLLRVPLAAPGGSALPWGKRPGRWASGLCSGCSSGEPPPGPSISWPLTLQVGCGIPWFSVKFAQKKAGVDW